MGTLVDMKSVGAYLLGTANSLDNALEEYGTTYEQCTIEQLDELDEITMCCDLCGWWVDTDEMMDDQTCGECIEEQNEKS